MSIVHILHLWGECLNGKIGDRICVKCGVRINLFDLYEGKHTIPPICKTA